MNHLIIPIIYSTHMYIDGLRVDATSKVNA